jgi:hypothetical protein
MLFTERPGSKERVLANLLFIIFLLFTTSFSALGTEKAKPITEPYRSNHNL